ncbi:fasciclin domain-containing protein [Paraurantiacibacter namhicola]|uniref:Cell surface lipoprotein MPB83 n=1 Tax=Paraurantiacibacter namhicola TaxID=645517 RepID=A0A1C7D739_9SPHN|nr:fasciclin domain-containing protein [Paraurantiacibacter namhicola]ANU07268.1 Cell surface lipoprotein MPB83 precursor [Paraurantiacibacter namhicola]
MKTVAFSSLGALALMLAACGEPATDTDSDTVAMADGAEATSSIVELVGANENLSNLATSVRVTGLEETLSGEGPFTVFAPTNAAFEDLPQGKMKKLATDDLDDLARILTYHTVAGEVRTPDLGTAVGAAGEEGYSFETVNGGTLTATVVDGEFVLTDANGNSARVIEKNVDASNGVVHIIDGVLVP